MDDLMPVDAGSRYTTSLAANMSSDKVIFANVEKYAEEFCVSSYEDACIGIDAFVQMLYFTDEANEGMYRLLAEFAGEDIDELWKITETDGFDGGSYRYNNRWFHFGYRDYGLVLLISGQE